MPSLTDDPVYLRLSAAYRCDEALQLQRLLTALELPAAARERAGGRARDLVEAVRRARSGALEAFMQEYRLSSQEGVVLMCLAEALLRIPDDATVRALIRDKLSATAWEQHLGHSDSLAVNASTWGLVVSGRVLRAAEGKRVWREFLRRRGEAVVRQAVERAMQVMARQFVRGRSIGEALQRSRPLVERGYRYSYDMLGEAARTQADCERYLQAYRAAIVAVGAQAGAEGPLAAAGVSVKLSALHPRYQYAQGERVLRELVPRLRLLALEAAQRGIGLTVDAEEADRLELSLEVFALVAADPQLSGWEGLGLAVQAYQKRAYDLLDYLAALARRCRRRLPVRLVKGAYWDTEIKRAQQLGLDDYPVFTRKVNTDVSYLACADRLLALREWLYPQFATHNAHTVATVLELAGESRDFEFQRLHGMGEALYDELMADDPRIACRIYAPVGSHEELLPYLVRRLLENGANTSFVNRIGDPAQSPEQLAADPVAIATNQGCARHPRIPLPRDLYAPERVNAHGVDLSDPASLLRLTEEMQAAAGEHWRAAPPVGGPAAAGERTVHNPADRRLAVGSVIEAGAADVDAALQRAVAAAPAWDRTAVAERAACLERTADLLERHLPRLVALCVREAGKTIGDGVAEVREAVDFCRYYAARARADFPARPLSGPIGELNQLALHGRGVFVCISPWNFPLAIFTGQVAAALVAGNAVLAKPAEQTPLIAAQAVELLYRAGVPGEVLQLLPGGAAVGAALVRDPRIAGVAFTGSTETAWQINCTLAARQAPIASLIAETGGQNAMVVDSSALLEQVVDDVLHSGFHSAGQRCSALRALFVQEDVAPRLLELLAGAMEELRVGDPAELATDVGPVIDTNAWEALEAHARRMQQQGRLIYRCPLPEASRHGSFFAPQAFEIDRLDCLRREVFGPVLHVIRYQAGRLEQVAEAVNATGYGLTFGVHSRIDSTVQYLTQRVRAGNVYVNRNMIGAVVGVQPFGGQGLSGTGPKAGGPHYLQRFASERAVSINTSAAGGNAWLMSLDD